MIRGSQGIRGFFAAMGVAAGVVAAVFLMTPKAESALSNSLTWAGTTNTNVMTSNFWSVSPAYTGANVWNMSNSIYQYYFTNTYSQLNGAQTFSFGGSNAGGYGYTFGGYTSVLVTNVGTFRLADGGFTATNGSGTGRVTIMNTNTSQLTSGTTFKGNMSVYMNNLYNHSSTGRTVTNNLNDLAINNLGINSGSQTYINTNTGSGISFTWEGTGTATILGTIMQIAQTNTTGTKTNNGALIVTSGTINIATTNAANASSAAINVDNSSVYGWNSGLVISNSGSVYIGNQNSLGMQAYAIKMGTTNLGTTTFGLFASNNWATNASSDVTITNNFVLGNATANGTATNLFTANGATKSLTLSGTITNTVAGNTLAVGAGTLNLSGNNSGLSENINILTNATLINGNANALGSGSVTVTVQSGGTLNLSSNNATIDALSGSGSIINSAGTNNLSLGNNNGSGTFTGSISNAIALIKNGTGTQTLGGSNAYSQGTTLNAGTLAISNSYALGSGTVTFASNSTTLKALANLNVGNNIALATNGTIDSGAFTVTNSGVISGAGALTKAGTGTMILTSSNSYSGGTTLNTGTLAISNSYALGDTNAALNVSGGTLTNASFNMVVGAVTLGNGSITGAGTLTGTSYTATNSGAALISESLAGSGTFTQSGAGTTTLSRSNSYSGGTTLNAGTLALSNSYALGSGTVTFRSNSTTLLALTNLNVSNNVALATNGTISSGAFTMTNSGVISGAGALIKAGAGTMVLTSSNSYSGGTTINAGGINISNGSSFGSGTVTFASNSTTLRVLANNQNIANDIVISQANSTLAIGPTNSGGWQVTNSGVISGAGAVGSGATATGNVYLMNTNNSFGGGVFATNGGTMYANYIGNSGDNSSFGANGTITIGNSSSAGGVRSINTNDETTDKVFYINSGSAYTASIFNTGTTNGATTLTLLSDLNVDNANNKTINLGAYNGNALAMSGAVNDGNGGWITTLIVGSSSTGTVFLNNTNNSFSGGAFVTNSTSGQTTTLQVNSFGNAGDTTSALGAGNVVLTGTAGTAVLKYAGAGETTTRVITLTGLNNTLAIDASGTGALVMNSALNMGNNAAHFVTLQGTNSGEITGNITNVATTNGTINKASVSNNSSNIALSSIVGLQVGQTVTGAGIAGSTTITAISAAGDGSGTITLSANTTNVSTISAGTRTYAFLNTADSTAVTVTNQTALTKSGAGTWTLSGSNTYSGGTLLNAGTLALSNSYALGTGTLTFASNNATLLAKANLNLTNNITLTTNGTIDSGAFTMTNSGVISGAGALIKTGAGTTTFTEANTYSGGTTIINGKLYATSGSALGSGTVTFAGGTTFGYTGSGDATISNNFSISSGTATIGNTSGSSLTLSGNISQNSNSLLEFNEGSYNLFGKIQGSGTTSLAGNSSLNLGTSGTITNATDVNVTSGTLLLGAANQVNSAANLILGGSGTTGTLSMGGNGSTRASEQTFGTLTLTGNSTINFANLIGSSTLTFTGAGSLAGYTLSIWNWNFTDTHLVFSQGSSALSSADLANINFFSDNGTTSLGSGEFSGTEIIVPVPEPSVIMAASLLVGFLLWSNRRSLRPRALVARRA